MSILDRYESGLTWLMVRERLLWIVVLLGYGAGDLATTLVGLWTGRASEAGPVAAAVVSEFGILSLVALKLATLGAFYLVWRLLAWPTRAAIPLAVAGVGVFVTVWNVTVLL